MVRSDFAQRAADQWQEQLSDLELSPAELAVAVRFSRLYMLQRSLDNRMLRSFEFEGIAGIDDFRLMALLRRSSADGLTNAELVEQLGGSKAGMSNRLERLVKRELVRRIPSEVDRRVHANALTDAGIDLAERLVADVTAARKPVFDGLTQDQITLVGEAMAVMINNLDPNG